MKVWQETYPAPLTYHCPHLNFTGYVTGLECSVCGRLNPKHPSPMYTVEVSTINTGGAPMHINMNQQPKPCADCPEPSDPED